MADAEVDRDVERHPSWSDRSLPAPALTRQAAGGRNPGSGEGREGNPKFATVAYSQYEATVAKLILVNGVNTRSSLCSRYMYAMAFSDYL